MKKELIRRLNLKSELVEESIDNLKARGEPDEYWHTEKDIENIELEYWLDEHYNQFNFENITDIIS